MLIDFFLHLRKAKLPVSINEHLLLLEAMAARVIEPSIDQFYFLSRATFVKDERNFDKFDRAFASYFKGVEDIPPEALRSTDHKSVIPPLHGALLKNEQDVHLFERLAYMARHNR